MDDDLRRWLRDTAPGARTGALDPLEIRRLARRRRVARRGLGGGAMLAAIAVAALSWQASTADDGEVRVVAPPEQTTTSTTERLTTTEEGVHRAPEETVAPAGEGVDWTDAPDACADPGTYALRADLSGDGVEEWVMTTRAVVNDDVQAPPIARVCSESGEVWAHQLGFIELFGVVQIDGTWFIEHGGTTVSSAVSWLLRLDSDGLQEVTWSDPVQLVQGRFSTEIPDHVGATQTVWWGCEGQHLVVVRQNPDDPNRLALHEYRYDADANHFQEVAVRESHLEDGDYVAADPPVADCNRRSG